MKNTIRKITVWVLLLSVLYSAVSCKSSDKSSTRKKKSSNQVDEINSNDDDLNYRFILMTVYDSSGEQMGVEEDEINADGKVISETRYENDGSISHWTKYEYDASGNITKEETSRICWKYGYEYDSKGVATKKLYYDDDDSYTRYDTYEYDSKGNLIKETTYDTYGSGHIWTWTEYEYDSDGNCTKKLNHSDDSNLDKVSDWVEYEYDDDGILVVETWYMHDTIAYEHVFDKHGNIIKATDYDDGSIVSVEEYDIEYDKAGRMLKMTVRNKKGKVEGWIEYEYNSESAFKSAEESGINSNQETSTTVYAPDNIITPDPTPEPTSASTQPSTSNTIPSHEGEYFWVEDGMFFIDLSLLGQSYSELENTFGTSMPALQEWEWDPGFADTYFDYYYNGTKYTFFFYDRVCQAIRYEIVSDDIDSIEQKYESVLGKYTYTFNDENGDFKGYSWRKDAFFVAVFYNYYEENQHVAIQYER